MLIIVNNLLIIEKESHYDKKCYIWIKKIPMKIMLFYMLVLKIQKWK